MTALGAAAPGTTAPAQSPAAAATADGAGAARPVWLATLLVLAAFNLRPALSSLGPVLPEITRDLAISTAQASVLTTAPVIGIGLCGLTAPSLIRRFGSERTVFALLVVIAAGSALRGLGSFAALLVGALIAGCAIGAVNVVLPSLIKRDFPTRISAITGLYSMALCVGASLAAGATAPLTAALGGHWNLALAAWLLPALLAAAAWSRRRGPPPAMVTGARLSATEGRGVWRNPIAWQVTIYLGTQASLAYVVFAWLAPLLRDRGVDAIAAGGVVSLSILSQVIASLGTPLLTGRLRNQSAVVVVLMSVAAIGFVVCAEGPLAWLLPAAVLLGIGQGGTFAIALAQIGLRAGSAQTAAALSSMSQSIGYLVAACGPLAFGLVHDYSSGWHVPTIVFLCVSIVAGVSGALASRARTIGRIERNQ